MLCHRDNIVMIKLAVFKKVKILLNDRTFYTKCKRVRRNTLPNNFIIKRTNKKGRRKGQRGCELGKYFRKPFSLAKKNSKSKVKEDIAKMAIENLFNATSRESANKEQKTEKDFANTALKHRAWSYL